VQFLVICRPAAGLISTEVIPLQPIEL